MNVFLRNFVDYQSSFPKKAETMSSFCCQEQVCRCQRFMTSFFSSNVSGNPGASKRHVHLYIFESGLSGFGVEVALTIFVIHVSINCATCSRIGPSRSWKEII